MSRFQGKVVLVTGGGSGQGAETCRLFAAEGADVAVADWNGDAARAVADEIGGRAIVVDVSREAEVKQMVESAAQPAGRLDILVNNAGVGYSESGRFKMAGVVDTPEEAWDAILAINLKGVAMGCKHALPIMAAQGGGAIVNIASINALVAMPGADAYTASKGGIVALTRVLARDWAPKGIRVNCICPGAIRTGMTHHIKEEHKTIFAKRRVPLRRYADPEEVAHGTLNFVLPASSYMNGAVLPVDAGLTIKNA